MPKKSIFVIGGVPEIGEVLAESVIKNVLEVLELSDVSFVLTGSHSHSCLLYTSDAADE